LSSRTQKKSPLTPYSVEIPKEKARKKKHAFESAIGPTVMPSVDSTVPRNFGVNGSNAESVGFYYREWVEDGLRKSKLSSVVSAPAWRTTWDASATTAGAEDRWKERVAL
jgi:hypothetical protein